MTTTPKTAGTDKAGNPASGAAKDSATSSEATQQRSARTATVNLPFVTATFRRPEMPQIRVPGRQEVLSAAQVVQPYLPSPGQAAYFGGLAALAAFEVLEWPVALAIGAGTALMGRSGRREPRSANQPESATVATKQDTTSTKGTTSSTKKT
jgi:hypothetical protein